MAGLPAPASPRTAAPISEGARLACRQHVLIKPQINDADWSTPTTFGLLAPTWHRARISPSRVARTPSVLVPPPSAPKRELPWICVCEVSGREMAMYRCEA